MPRPALAVLPLAAAILALAAPAARADCPGQLGPGGCVYTGVAQIGQRTSGVLRFPQTVAVGPDGTVYVGDQGSHAVQAFSPEGAFLRDFGFAGRKPGQITAVGGLAVAGDGSVLVAEGRNRIDRYSAAGQLLTSWGRSGTDLGEFRFGQGGGNDAGAGGGLAVGGGFVYVADTGNDRIQRFDLEGGHGAEIVPPGTLAAPQGLAVRGTRLLVADDQHHRLVVFDTGGRQLAITGDASSGMGQLKNPYDVAVDPQGRVFVADDLNHRVVRYSSPPRYPYKARWGSYGTAAGQLAYPRGIAADRAGNVYVANTGNDRIDVFDRGGQLLRSFGSSGRAVGQFDEPLGIAADASGVRAVTDAVNGRIQLLAPDGTILSAWGSPAPGPTILPRPVAVAFLPSGDAAVLDQRRGRIVVFARETGLPSRTMGSRGSGPAQMLAPTAMAVDGAGTLWVADAGNQRIVRFGGGGTYLGALTGTGEVRGLAISPDGQRIYAADDRNRITVYSPSGDVLDEFGGRGRKLGKLEAPGQMTVDAAGNLWVADRGNNRVQQFGPDGQRLAAFGSRGTGPGQFIHPTGVSIDCNGLLTVSDSDNNRIQQFQLAAPAATGCAQLPPVGTPPPPKLPTLPEPAGPQVSTRVLRSTSVLRARSLPLRVGCDTACDLTATATLTPAAKPRKHHKPVVVTLRTVRRELAAGASGVVRFKVSARQVRSLRRALRGRKSLTADVEISAAGATGEPTVVSKRLRVTS